MKWILRILGAVVVLLVAAFFVFRTPDTDPAEMRAKYGGPPSQFVEIGDGVSLHVRDEGPRDGVPIMLLHGSNADLHTWQPWVDALADSYRVIRFDQVGHGLTGADPAQDYSRENYVEDIRELADTLGLDSFILGGNSMGGKHALAFAASYPQRVDGLILVDASGGPMPETAQAEEDEDGGGNIGFAIAQLPGINRVAEQITPRSLIAQSLEQTVSVQQIVTEEMVDRYWELLRYPGNRAATMARFSNSYDPLTETQIRGLTMPALIIWGDEDRLIPLTAGEWLHAAMPSSTFVHYPGIGHLPHEEAPDRSLADLEEWLVNFSQE